MALALTLSFGYIVLTFMPLTSKARKTLLLYFLHRANETNVKLDLVKLNMAFTSLKGFHHESGQRHGFYDLALVSDLTELWSDDLITIKDDGKLSYVVLTSSGKNEIENRSAGQTHIMPSGSRIMATEMEGSGLLGVEPHLYFIPDLLPSHVNQGPQRADALGFFGDLKRQQGDLEQAAKYYSSAIIWADDEGSQKAEFCFDLSDTFEKMGKRMLAVRCFNRTENLFKKSLSNRKLARLSKETQYLVDFRNRFCMAIARSSSSGKVSRKPLQEAWRSYESFLRNVDIEKIEQTARKDPEIFGNWLALFHECGHASYSTQHMPAETVDYLLRNDNFSIPKNRYITPFLLELIGLSSIQASICASLLGMGSTPQPTSDLMQLLMAKYKNDPVGKLSKLISSFGDAEKLEFDLNLLQKFDTDIRKAVELLFVEKLEGDLAKVFSVDYGMSDEEAQDVLSLLDSMVQ
jgi:tetratricopeptide (TPR) repeat protein